MVAEAPAREYTDSATGARWRETMPKFAVTKSITIDAPAAKVWPHVRQFENWVAWSPWLCAEPDCKVTYQDDRKGYGWEGKIVGSGKIDLLADAEPSSMDMKLTFLAPWKSENDTAFKLDERDGKTTVTWEMSGSLPFFLFFMKKMMTAWVGMDYERGLSMLKAIVETGSNPSQLDFPGTASFSGTDYVGVRSACSLAKIGPSMEADMKKLGAFMQEGSHEASGAPLSIYHKFNPVKDQAEYTIAVPVASKPASVPSGIVTGTIPALQTYRIKHTGPYPHLGNAWAAGVMHERAKRYAKNKSQHPFEVYENDPTEVAANDLVTVVHFPVK